MAGPRRAPPSAAAAALTALLLLGWCCCCAGGATDEGARCDSGGAAPCALGDGPTQASQPVAAAGAAVAAGATTVRAAAPGGESDSALGGEDGGGTAASTGRDDATNGTTAADGADTPALDASPGVAAPDAAAPAASVDGEASEPAASAAETEASAAPAPDDAVAAGAGAGQEDAGASGSVSEPAPKPARRRRPSPLGRRGPAVEDGAPPAGSSEDSDAGLKPTLQAEPGPADGQGDAAQAAEATATDGEGAAGGGPPAMPLAARQPSPMAVSSGLWQQDNLACWGDSEYGQAAIPTNLEPFSYLHLSGDTTYTIAASDGLPRSFGCGGVVAPPPEGTGPLKAMCATSYAACGIKAADNKVVCWSPPDRSSDLVVLRAPTNVAVRSLTCGKDFAAAVFISNSSSVAWGSQPNVVNAFKQNVSSLAAGGYHLCAILNNKRMVCWGDRYYGQLTTPTNPFFAKAMSASDYTSCAIKPDGYGVCWGQDGAALTPPVTWGRLKALVTGSGFSCAALESNSTIRCLTEPSTWAEAGLSAAMEPPSGVRAKALLAGYSHACATDAKNKLFCWGNNYCQQATVPRAPGLVASVAASRRFTCAVTSGAEARCWGTNQWGATTPPSDLGPVESVTVGPEAACAITTAKQLRCWGEKAITSVVPTNLGNVSRVAIADRHICAVTEREGRLVCWHDASDNHPLVPPDNPGRVLDICAGSMYFCLLNSSTNVTCWGRYYINDYQTVASTIPVGLTRVAALTCGPNHVCARRQNGRTVCWAYSVIRTDLTRPPSPDAANTSFTAGYDFTIGLSGPIGATDRLTPSCWGSDTQVAQVCKLAPARLMSRVSAWYLHACAVLSV